MISPRRHPTHQWPEMIEIGARCVLCGAVVGSVDAGLRCLPVENDAHETPHCGMEYL